MGEIRLFFTALTFYTRLPGLRLADVDSDGLSRATHYLPLVGVIVGGIAAAVFLGVQILLPQGSRCVAVHERQSLDDGRFPRRRLR
ncbi:MAG TPA: hypothetical protein DIC52_02430 [Candidatus Latescibacteria bacterium]|nr:hypothetical protein [Candidatus Latescibacterota bacterium]